MDEAASAAGTVVSAVLLGAIAGSGALPFGNEACLAAIDALGARRRGEPARVRARLRVDAAASARYADVAAGRDA